MLTFMLTLILLGAAQDPSHAPEQETSIQEPTRTEELQQAREEKAQHLQKPRRRFLERAHFEFKERRLVERFQEGAFGLRPLLGGIHSGSGFGGGASYEKSGIHASA